MPKTTKTSTASDNYDPYQKPRYVSPRRSQINHFRLHEIKEVHSAPYYPDLNIFYSEWSQKIKSVPKGIPGDKSIAAYSIAQLGDLDMISGFGLTEPLSIAPSDILSSEHPICQAVTRVAEERLLIDAQNEQIIAKHGKVKYPKTQQPTLSLLVGQTEVNKKNGKLILKHVKHAVSIVFKISRDVFKEYAKSYLPPSDYMFLEDSIGIEKAPIVFCSFNDREAYYKELEELLIHHEGENVSGSSEYCPIRSLSESLHPEVLCLSGYTGGELAAIFRQCKHSEIKREVSAYYTTFRAAQKLRTAYNPSMFRTFKVKQEALQKACNASERKAIHDRHMLHRANCLSFIKDTVIQNPQYVASLQTEVCEKVVQLCYKYQAVRSRPLSNTPLEYPDAELLTYATYIAPILPQYEEETKETT